MRNVVAIIGSAGKITEDLRLQVEELAQRLSNSGFDLVTGGMDGVMRAVARGHSKSHSSSKLVHVEPGWDEPWRLNPFEAGIVKTGLGSMRNHLLIRSADLVIAIAGGSGTLSEIAIAWQEGKQIATLSTSGGWSERLSGESLDHRRDDKITDCESVDELVKWADSMRPSGVFTGRLNRGFYPFEVPVLHRIHEEEATGCQVIHARYGMSIERSVLLQRLSKLNNQVQSWDSNAVGLVTFDDGWRDVLLLEGEFDALDYLRPVLFIGENQFADTVRPLPLQRLYQHCANSGIEVEDLRGTIKSMTQNQGDKQLADWGIPEMLNPNWLLRSEDLERLASKGWIIASHGHLHQDLSTVVDLSKLFSALSESIEQRVHTPWLAWPEGRWSYGSVEAASEGGFIRQFGLLDEPHDEPPVGMVMRKIWS